MIRWWDFRQPCTSLVEHSQPNAPEHALQKSCKVFGRDHATKQTDEDHERSKLKRSWSNDSPVKGNLLVWNEWLKFKKLDHAIAGKSAAISGLAIWDTAAMVRLSFLVHPASILVAVGFACASVPGGCAEQMKTEAAKPMKPAGAASEAKQFCTNNLAVARDARLAWQTSKLLDLEAQIKQRLADLEARKAQLVDWLRKHDEAMKKATDDVIAIYAHMKPDAAASQLAVMDDATAVAVIAKLPPRVAGTILDEMDPPRAAQLTHGMLAPETAPAGKKS